MTTSGQGDDRKRKQESVKTGIEMVCRLAMFLYAAGDDINSLSFVKQGRCVTATAATPATTATTAIATNKLSQENLKQERQQQREEEDEEQRREKILRLKQVLENEIKELVLKIGCFNNLFYLIKQLKANGNDNNKGDISSVVNIFRKYIEEFECGNYKSSGGYRFLLSGVNEYEKEKQSLYDVIIETENDYLKKFFIGKYMNVFGVSPMTTSENESLYVSLSSDILSDLKTLGLGDTRIKKMDKNGGDGCARITVLGVDINHIGAGRDSSLRMSKFNKFECILIGCKCLLDGFDSKDFDQVFLNNLQQVYNSGDAKMIIEKVQAALTQQQWKILEAILQCNDLGQLNTSNESKNSSAEKPQLMYGCLRFLFVACFLFFWPGMWCYSLFAVVVI